MRIYIIILLFVLFIFILLNKTKKKFTETYDLVISINVHEKFTFLQKQLENIKQNVSVNYCIILNCNQYMYDECQNKLPDNVYINPNIIEKRRIHGSIAHGIYSNMLYALKHIKFQYFLVCSSRNFIENDINLEKLDKLEPTPYAEYNQAEYDGWHWPTMHSSLIFKYFNERKEKLYATPHEGVLFKYNDVLKIKEFLEKNEEIKNDTFNYNGPMEEFSLQTISMNNGGEFYYIGNGCCTEDRNGVSDKKFTYKVIREGLFLNKFPYS